MILNFILYKILSYTRNKIILILTRFTPLKKSIFSKRRLSLQTFFLSFQPDNILLHKKSEVFPEIRLIDFGLSRRLDGPYSQFDIVGTPEYVGRCHFFLKRKVSKITLRLLYFHFYDLLLMESD